MTDSTYGQVGIKFGSVGIPLQTITGSATDSLNAIGTDGFYPNDPEYLAWFPMNYGDDQRNSNYVVDNQFLLTAAGFGLNRVPTANKVFEHPIVQPKGAVNEHIQFDQRFNSGHYFYVLQDGNRRIMSSGGLQKN